MRKIFSFLCMIPVLGLLNLQAQTTETILISGTGCDDGVLWDFTVNGGMNANHRSKIPVPSCWEQHGFGEYTYGRWYTKPDGAPSTESGVYECTFTIPASWRGKIVEICFDGVMTDATVYINGTAAGETHRGAFTPFSYDISDLVRYGGKNRLRVVVDKESADDSVNAAERKADWWLFGGIYRPVRLTARPANSISRATVDAHAGGILNIQLLTDGSEGSQVKAVIPGLGERTAVVTSDSCLVSFCFDSPRLWDPEHPNLYDLNLQLLDSQGNVLHQTYKRIGFRTIEFRRGDGFYLNGTKLLVKGVNRHCFYPASGRTTSHALDLEDVKLIKRMNANAIRSHYPPDTHLLDICDSLGILYLDELAGWHNAYRTEIGSGILREMVVRDASHPCIFAWSNGNEGGFNYDLDPLFAAYDPQQRHVLHAWALWDGVDTHHYPAYQTGVDRLQFGHDVFMPTEFLHSQYDKGGGASLRDFWQNWRQSPLFAGGFIWAWADEGIERSDRGGRIDTDGPNAPDGIVGPHREKEASWFAIRDVWSPVRIAPFNITPCWDGNITVHNDFLFSDLSECRLFCNDIPVTLPHALPGEAVRISLPFDAGAEITKIVALGPDNDTLNVWSQPTISAAEHFARHRRDYRSTAIDTIGFDPGTGNIDRLVVRGREMDFRGPIPVGFDMDFKEGSYRHNGDTLIYVAKYTGGCDSIVWRLEPDGLLGMDAVLFNDKGGHGHRGEFIHRDARAFGLSFTYPETECTGMQWLGRGPYRVWRNRLDGQTFGLWLKEYNNTVTGEGELLYPEFKGYHADVYVARIESGTSPLTVISETDGLYLRIFTPAEPEHRRDGKNTMEPFPAGDISLLVDIPPIQSYKPLEQLGPQAMVPTVRINKGDEGIRIKVWFRFD